MLRSVLRSLFVNNLSQIKSASRFLFEKGCKGRVRSKLENLKTVKMECKREEIELLSAVNDHHGGVIVEMKDSINADAFARSLRASLANWRQQGKRGVWIKLPINLANLVQPAVEEGFWYHHAEPNYLMLVYWIPASPHTLPVNATHRVGVGAFVINEKKEVLVVQEKTGILRGLGVWKFPTGVVEEVNFAFLLSNMMDVYRVNISVLLDFLLAQGEDISVGAVREVKEETGIDTEFVEVLAFRQSHKAFFKKSDLFFVCMLRPLSFDIEKQESEIEEAQWMPIDEYAVQPFVQKHELLKYIVDIGYAKIEKGYTGFSPLSIKSTFSEGDSYLYLNNKDLNQSS